MKKLNHLLLLLAYISISAYSVSAQDNNLTENLNQKSKVIKLVRTSVYFEYGVHFGNYDEINSLLLDSNLSVFTNIDFAVGGGFTAKFDKLILQLDFYKLTQCVENEAKICSHVDHNSIGLSFGYRLNKGERHIFYPLVGIHRNITEFFITNNDLPAMTFNNYFTSVSNVSHVTKQNYSTNIGLGYDYLIPLNTEYRLNPVIGFRTGYHLNLYDGTWYEHIDENEVKDGPSVNPGGAYFKLVAGFYF